MSSHHDDLPDHDSQLIFISRVCLCGGWATHGAIVELQDGSRRGILLANEARGHPLPIDQNFWIRERRGSWVDLKQEGDYLVRVSGHQLRPGAGGGNALSYLCHSLRWEFASGQVIEYQSPHDDWRGEAFAFDIPRTQYVQQLKFEGGACRGVDRAIQTSLHLCLSPETAHLLPLRHQKVLLNILGMTKRQDAKLEAAGSQALVSDAWWRILSFLKGHELIAVEKMTRKTHPEFSLSASLLVTLLQSTQSAT